MIKIIKEGILFADGWYLEFKANLEETHIPENAVVLWYVVV